VTAPRPGLVLVLDKDGATARALGLLIRDWGYDCAHGASLEALSSKIEGRLGEVVAIIAEGALADGRTGLEAIEAARRLGVAAPALILTSAPARRGEAGDAQVRRMQKPVSPQRLRTWLASTTNRN
jgi:hypothetical protein